MCCLICDPCGWHSDSSDCKSETTRGEKIKILSKVAAVTPAAVVHHASVFGRVATKAWSKLFLLLRIFLLRIRPLQYKSYQLLLPVLFVCCTANPRRPLAIVRTNLPLG